MTTPSSVPADQEVWLSIEQQCAWRELAAVLQLLPAALDRQLQDDVGVSHTYYMVLAMLSEAPQRSLRMATLAAMVSASQSRLTHAVNRLEERGWVVRTRSIDDKRGQIATLTDAGFATLVEFAPGHAAEVRRRVFDVLTDDEVQALGCILTKITAGLRRDRATAQKSESAQA